MTQKIKINGAIRKNSLRNFKISPQEKTPEAWHKKYSLLEYKTKNKIVDKKLISNILFFVNHSIKNF